MQSRYNVVSEIVGVFLTTRYTEAQRRMELILPGGGDKETVSWRGHSESRIAQAENGRTCGETQSLRMAEG